MSKIKVVADADYFKVNSYLSFDRTTEASILRFLISYIIRNPEKIVSMNEDMRKDFIKFVDEGKLVSRFPQKTIGEKYKLSQSSISKYLKKLETYGFIKIIRKRFGKYKEMVCYYQLGTFTIDDEGITKETLFFDKFWEKQVKESKEIKAKYNLPK